MKDTRLIIVEGIMGSGKSTTASFIARQLRKNGVEAKYQMEAEYPHPIKVMAELPHPLEPWLDLSVDEYIEKILGKWRAYVEGARESRAVLVLDGQLFHGDTTNLFMMDADASRLLRHVRDVADIARCHDPLLIYLYQADVAEAVKQVMAERGAWFEEYQTGWKLQSPYARRRKLEGLTGFIDMYQDYRRLTDKLFATLDTDKLAIENSQGDWPKYRRDTLSLLSLPPNEDTDISW